MRSRSSPILPDRRLFWARKPDMIARACSGPRAMSEPWVPVDEVSGHLGVAKDTTYRWIESRGLPAHRVGRLWKFKLSEVDAWVQRGGADHDRSATPPKRGRT